MRSSAAGVTERAAGGRGRRTRREDGGDDDGGAEGGMDGDDEEDGGGGAEDETDEVEGVAEVTAVRRRAVTARGRTRAACEAWRSIEERRWGQCMRYSRRAGTVGVRGRGQSSGLRRSRRCNRKGWREERGK